MGTGPIIISDDGSPPPAKEDLHLRVSRRTEFMQELTSANGIHIVANAGAITNVRITQPDVEPVNHVVREKVEVLGNLDTSVRVRMDSGKVVVMTKPPLNEDFEPGFGRYAAADTTIAEVIIDDIVKFTANQKLVRIDITVGP